MDCQNNIIGLLKEESCCLVGLDYVESLSGLYLDDTTAGRIPLNVQFFENYENYNRIIPEAFGEAVNLTRARLDLNLVKKYRQNRSLIGYRDDWTNYENAYAGYYFISLKPFQINGGLIRLNAVNIYTSGGKHTGNIVVVRNGVEVYNGLQSAFVPMNFDMTETIYIGYIGDPPRNFKHTGCCGKIGTYRGWCEIGSGKAMTTAEFTHTCNDYSNGIELDVVFDCNAFGPIFCDIDFKNSGFGYAFASLVQNIARKNLAYYVLTNDKISSYLMTHKEELSNIINYLTSQIELTLNYLPQAYNESDCYICNGIYKGQILI